jgi:hypothetical protein
MASSFSEHFVAQFQERAESARRGILPAERSAKDEFDRAVLEYRQRLHSQHYGFTLGSCFGFLRGD